MSIGQKSREKDERTKPVIKRKEDKRKVSEMAGELLWYIEQVRIGG